jgi:hypothetical protein
MNYQPIIESKYNRENWMNLLFDIFKSNVEIWSSPILTIINNDIAKQTFILGKITLTDGHKLGIYEIQLNDNIQIERNKVSIRNLLVTDWHNKGMDGAFMFCYKTNESVLRFSYVSESWSLGEDSQIETSSTDTRRFTYYLGEGHRCRTAIQQFEILRESSLTLQDVTAAFNVDTLSKAFFDGYKKLYEDIVAFVTGKRMVKEKNKWIEKLTEDGPNQEMMIQFAIFDNPEKTVRDYIKKLLGRLVFLQFIQKKGWLGVRVGNDWGTGDREYLQHLFDNTDLQATFIDDVLEPLFYFINNEHNDEDTTKCKILGVGIRVPYLNGGLFERDKEDDAKFNLPIKYLKEIFEFFSQYNFTIDENDPDDAEIGVDPEMLGRIFENLLEDNKDKGAFYTPKEIVQYMCKESLISYLQIDKSEIDKEIIRIFVSEHNAQNLSDRLKSELEKKLENVKICDPAIGSGAFPMGLLRELLYCRHAINDKQNIYTLKKNIIENNIYGVDIEKGAIDIARLRFWLSIIVDSDKPESLPNFDYKFMQGNSLLECYNGVDLSTLTRKKKSLQTSFLEDTRDTLRLQLKSYLKHYYNEADHQKKKELKQKIAGNIDAQMKEAGYNLDFTNLDVSANNHFFLWHTWFSDVFDGDHDGFDIVIGNPPYIQLQNNGGELGEIYAQGHFETFARTGDIYCLFYECGWLLLKNKGHLCFITSNKWMRAGYGEATRNFFATKTNPKLLIDFAGVKVFNNATVDTNIILTAKENNEHNTFCAVTSKQNKESINNLSYFVEQNHTVCDFSNSNSWVILSPIEQSIKRKIETIGTPLKDWDINIYRGVLTGYNEAFVISTNKREEILANCVDTDEHKRTEDLIRPILRGRDIKRYGYDWANLWLIYIPWHFPYQFDNNITGASEAAEKAFKEQYSAVYNHMLQYKESLSKRNKAETGVCYEWYAMQRWGAKYWEDFNKPKIVYPNMTKYMPFVYDNRNFITNQKCFIITGQNLTFLTAFFNSSLFKKCFRDSFPELQGGTRELSKMFFEEIPVVNITEEQAHIFEIEVRNIQQSYTKSKAIAIDEIIFDLYKLTKEEREIIGFIEIQ